MISRIQPTPALLILFAVLLAAGCSSSQPPQDASRLERIAAKSATTGAVVVLSDASWQAEVIEASNSAPVLVDLWATWCGPCKVQGPIVDQLAKEMPEARFAKLDVDKNKVDDPLDIQAIPTLLIYRNGVEVQRIVGLTQKAELASAVRSHL